MISPGAQIKRRKRLIIHMRSVLACLARDLQIDPCDLNYVLRRLRLEGPSFVTKTLPAFSKYVLLCCEKQQWLSAPEVGLTNFAVKRNFPIFMRGLFIKAVTGCAESLNQIRQFCEYFYKTCFGFEKSVIKQAEEKYVSIDQSYSREKIDWGKVESIRKRMESIFPSLFSHVPSDLYRIVRPHDGPGAFAHSESITEQRSVSIWEYKKLPSSEIGLCGKAQAPFAGYFKGYPSSKERVVLVPDDTISELRFVPKDSRGPRVISKEPLHLLRAQMSAGKAIAALIEKDTKGQVNFTDQTVNQELARVSSITQERATVDLESASDRTWLTVARAVSRFSPALRYAITLRSTHVRLPSGRVMRLNKLANMGSGVCFPFLAMMVYATSVTALIKDCGYSLNEAMSSVNVYGDDLIVPRERLATIIMWLEGVGYLANKDKTFSNGYFRESCGADYYHGLSVAPVRLRLSNEGLDPVREYRNGCFPVVSAAGLNQLDRHCRELVSMGFDALPAYYYKQLEKRLGELPYIAYDSPFLGRYDPSRIVFGFRDKTLRGYIPVTDKSFNSDVCPLKGLGQSFSSRDGLIQDWCLTPLRRTISLKRRVPSASELDCIGRTDHPEDIFPLWKNKY